MVLIVKYLGITLGWLHLQPRSLEDARGSFTVLPRRGAGATGRKGLHVRTCMQYRRRSAAPHRRQSDKPDDGIKQRDEDVRWLTGIMLSGGTIKPQITQS
jgi:hypothetical protein